MEATFHRTRETTLSENRLQRHFTFKLKRLNATCLMMLHKLGYAYGGHKHKNNDGTTYMTDRRLFDNKNYLVDKNGQPPLS